MVVITYRGACSDVPSPLRKGYAPPTVRDYIAALCFVERDSAGIVGEVQYLLYERVLGTYADNPIHYQVRRPVVLTSVCR